MYKILVLGFCCYLTGCSVANSELTDLQNLNKRKIIFVKSDVSLDEMKQTLQSKGIVIKSEIQGVHAIVVEISKNKEDEIKNLTEDIEDDIKTTLQKPIHKKTVYIGAEQTPWGVQRIGTSSYTGYGVKVAVMDSGIDYTHPDLNVSGGINFVDSNSNYYDGDGHGTHVAGTIAAQKNGIGVIGVAPYVKLYAVKILDDNGDGYISDSIKGFEWCINNGIRVINVSAGFPKNAISNTLLQQLENVIARAYNQGIVIVCSAGNNYGDVEYPAALPEVIAVSATDDNDNLADFSSRGPEVDIAAPGVEILSTVPGGYDSYDGTSMAAPHVTGAVALLIQKNPNLNANQIREKLKNTGVKLSLPDTYFGSGGLVSVPKLLN